jgi:hypothetical protein
VSSHTFSVQGERFLTLLLNKLGKWTPEAEIRKELKYLHINVKAVLHLRWKQRIQEHENGRPLTAHIIVSGGQISDVAKVRSLKYRCGLLENDETYKAQKCRCSANASTAWNTSNITAALHLNVWFAGTRKCQGTVSL